MLTERLYRAIERFDPSGTDWEELEEGEREILYWAVSDMLAVPAKVMRIATSPEGPGDYEVSRGIESGKQSNSNND